MIISKSKLDQKAKEFCKADPDLKWMKALHKAAQFYGFHNYAEWLNKTKEK